MFSIHINLFNVMTCPQCRVELHNSPKFCPECGASLAGTSPREKSSPSAEVNQTILLQKYIPAELAKKILSAGAQIESERRLVTVMFADVSGFTALSEKLDAEEVSTVLNDCFKGLISIVYKYEGVIDKFIGDELMAIFGAPIAHENDPERAVRCAVEMMEYIERFNSLSPVSLPEPLGLHIAMNTGMVVAGNVGSDLRMNYSVIGDTVNLASRLKHVAEKGETAVSENTYRMISSLVTTKEPKKVEVKGKSESAKVYIITSLKEEIEPGTRVTLKSEIIGREEELQVLESSLQSIKQKKEQRVFIRGEAGVGKTRLKLELIALARAKNITVYEGKCSSFEINTPYYLWTTLLKDVLQLKPDTGESETRKRLHDMLQILSLEKQEPYLATLLSLRYEEILLEEDQERKRKIFESLKEFIRGLSLRKSSIFILEDVHWIDRFSQDLLRYLFSEEKFAPSMFVPLFRDEYQHSREMMQKGGIQIDLNRLKVEEARKLMCARLNVADLPEILAQLIYKRSEGNPFFIEELVKTLFDRKIIEVNKGVLVVLKQDVEQVLPETVQGVIMARIDRLEEKLKEVLYGASVIGREFDKPLLKEIIKKKDAVDPSLHELLSLEMILEKDEAKEMAYLFKHYLIQEVAYNTILQKKRRELHKLIAQAIEKVYADKLKEFYELLSFHYEKAEDWEKAANYLSLSGRKAEEIFSKSESSDFAVRRVEAVKKLYSTESAKRPILSLILKIFTIFVTIPLVMALISFPIWMLFKIKFRFDIATFALAIPFIIVGTASAVFVAGLIAFASYNIVFKKRISLFDIHDDRITIQTSEGKELSIHFSNIKAIQKTVIINFSNSLKSFILFFKTFRPGYTLTMLGMLPSRLMWYYERKDWLIGSVFGMSSKEGYVTILQSEGVSYLQRLIRPWIQLTPLRSQAVSLTPGDPKIFFDHLSVAILKWKSKPSPKVQRPKSDDVVFSIIPEFQYGIVLTPFLPAFFYFFIYGCFGVLAILLSQKGVPIEAQSIFGLFLCIGIVILFIPLLLKPIFNKTKFEFTGSQLSYSLHFRNAVSGAISYDNISEVNVVRGYFQKKMGYGTIELVLLVPVTIDANRQPLSAIYISNVKNPEEAAARIRSMLK